MTRSRRVQRLEWARLEPVGPFADNPKVKGRAAEGLAYQRYVCAELRRLGAYGPVFEGQWIRYRDRNGTHWCQFDWALETLKYVVVCEIKLSQRRTPEAIAQLNSLYKPTVELIFNKPVIAVMAFRHWHRDHADTLPQIQSPEDLLYLNPKQAREPRAWNFL